MFKRYHLFSNPTYFDQNQWFLIHLSVGKKDCLIALDWLFESRFFFFKKGHDTWFSNIDPSPVTPHFLFMLQKNTTKEILIYFLLSFFLCGLVTAPAWNFDDDLKHITAFLFVIAMWTPGVSAIALFLFTKKQHQQKFRDFFHIRIGENWMPHYIFHIFFWPFAALSTPFIGHLFGFFELDMTFGGFAKIIQDMADTKGVSVSFDEVPIKTIVVMQIMTSFTGFFVNIPFAIGEELGWRGFLLPRLKPLGFWKANIICGVMWGLWHTPLILLGHNYPNHEIQGIFLMVLFCIILGTLLNVSVWKSNSIWPAVFGHGAINGSAGVIVLFQSVDYQIDTRLVGMTGITGWILPVIAIVILYVMNQYPKKESTLLKKSEV